MPTKLTIPFSVIGFVLFIYACASHLNGKADKGETDAIRKNITEVEKNHALLAQKIDYVIRDTTDANSKLDFIIKEMLRSRDPSSQLPPPPTPSPLSK